MDLSKALDCIEHELLIAKLSAYGFCKNALLMIYSYMTGRKQRVKVNGSALGERPLQVYRKDQFLDLFF